MKITILDKASFGEDISVERLETIGELTVYDKTSPDKVIERIKGQNVVIINKVKMTREVIMSSDDLKLICVFATGFDNIDIKTARERGVAVCNVPGYSTDSVVLFTVSTVLALYSHLIEYNNFVKSGEYTASGLPNRLVPVFHELKGKIWGIIGCGNIGKGVAKVAEAFGARVIVNKRTPAKGFECVDIDTLCKESDIITIHCPLTDATRGLIDYEKISLMKPDVVIVNEARGAVINEKDIAQALIDGRIGAFGSDVFSVEPFGEDHPFFRIKDMKNALLTPHAAWGAYEARVRCLDVICENILSFASGGRNNRVDLL